MKQLGMQQVDIPANVVIIKSDDKEIIITNPSVQKINMMGQLSFQISGEVEERESASESAISEEDIKTVMAQADVDRKKALSALEKSNGDLAEAILNLTKSE